MRSKSSLVTENSASNTRPSSFRRRVASAHSAAREAAKAPGPTRKAMKKALKKKYPAVVGAYRTAVQLAYTWTECPRGSDCSRTAVFSPRGASQVLMPVPAQPSKHCAPRRPQRQSVGGMCCR